ncbi:hypothetical protein IJG72_08200 [bacterium]|nr:hypothetical protein [bacterium]
MKISLSPVVTFRANPNDQKNLKNQKKTGELNESGNNQIFDNLPIKEEDSNSPLFHSKPFILLPDLNSNAYIPVASLNDSYPYIQVENRNTSKISTTPRSRDTSGLIKMQNSAKQPPQQSTRHDTIVTQTLPEDVRSTNVSNLTELQNLQTRNTVGGSFDRKEITKPNNLQQGAQRTTGQLDVPPPPTYISPYADKVSQVFIDGWRQRLRLHSYKQNSQTISDVNSLTKYKRHKLHRNVYALDSDCKYIPVTYAGKIVRLKYNYKNLLVKEITDIYPQYFNSRPEPVFVNENEMYEIIGAGLGRNLIKNKDLQKEAEKDIKIAIENFDSIVNKDALPWFLFRAKHKYDNINTNANISNTPLCKDFKEYYKEICGLKKHCMANLAQFGIKEDKKLPSIENFIQIMTYKRDYHPLNEKIYKEILKAVKNDLFKNNNQTNEQDLSLSNSEFNNSAEPTTAIMYIEELGTTTTKKQKPVTKRPNPINTQTKKE